MFKAEIKGAPEGSTPLRVERVRRRGLKAENKEALFDEVNDAENRGERVCISFTHNACRRIYLEFSRDIRHLLSRTSRKQCFMRSSVPCHEINSYLLSRYIIVWVWNSLYGVVPGSGVACHG